MKLSWLCLLSLFLFTLFHAPTFALKQSYIVYLGGHSHGPEVSEMDFHRATNNHYNFLASFLGSSAKAKESIFYSYNKHINGFSALLDEEEALAISKHPKVISVFLDKGRKLHTTHSWNFMQVEKDDADVPSSSIWKKARFGEDTIIANLDTGVWSESPSFRDEGMGPVPYRWKGKCDNNIPCNRKLIGARYFAQGYVSNAEQLNVTINTPMLSGHDEEGHGSHTLSTLGGSFVSNASVYGAGLGTAKGGSPRARVASYKVCWNAIDDGGSCFDSDILAAYDTAIHDGVDVLSLSLGGDPTDYFNDGISIGAFHAVKKGITVVCSAGNSGPNPGTVSNGSPWILTIGASTMDRDFSATVTLGNDDSFIGQTLSETALPVKKQYPLISAADAKAANASAEDALLCKPYSLDRKKAEGKILVCLRGDTARADKGMQAALAGAVGMILCNDKTTGNELFADPHFLPAIHINYIDGLSVFKHINSTKSPVAYITPVQTHLNHKPAPSTAVFSSRGPNIVTPEILKPDITAPGVNVIAAFTQATSPTGLDDDHRRILFNTMSGTSMSCPHISGIAGLIKTLHPDWSPAAIKSAIMTSARTLDNNNEPMLDAASFQKATPFDYGAGHVRPNRVGDPGLVYDLTTKDYLNFLCALGYNKTLIELFSDEPYKCPESYSLFDFNYPSITVHMLDGSVTVTRTVKNVGSPTSRYRVTVHRPNGIEVTVTPGILEFKEMGEEKIFKVTLRAKSPHAARDYVFGGLTWSDGKHYVRTPIVVKADHEKA